MLALLFAATAAAAGFYHPNDVAGASERFASAQGELLAPLEARQQTARELSNALRSYREGLDALGADAPAEQLARLATAETAYLRQFEALQRFADTLVGDFDEAFTAAMERALSAQGGATECVREIAVGPRVPGMAGRTQANPACQGDDLNQALAAAIDADPTLIEVLPTILQRPWPDLAVAESPQPPVGAGDRYVHLQALLTAGAGSALRAIDRDDDDQRMAIEAKLEDGADAAELETLQGVGEQIAQSTAAKRAQLAQPIRQAADKELGKWAKAEGPTAWCVQPQRLGGCVGTDATAELVPRLLDTKGVGKALP